MAEKSKQELGEIIRTSRKAALIVNTHSRNGERLYQQALSLLRKQGIVLLSSHPVSNPKKLREVTQTVLDQGYTLVIIGGGDGTFNTLIDLFVHRDVVLGILPLGTANNFARSMEIPMKLSRAIDVIVGGKVVDVDLGMINGQYFINIASIGFSRDVIRATPRSLKKYLGVFSYLLYETKYLISQELFLCRIRIQDQVRELHTRQLIIANGSFYGTRRITPDAHIDNRTLLIFTMDSMSRWQGLKFWIGYLLGRHLKFPESRIFAVDSAVIETIPEKYAIMGGEKTSRTPLFVSVDPAALRVIAPVNFFDHDEIHPMD
jgi:YegS/Rv2252/BmrU family lipid kinase